MTILRLESLTICWEILRCRSTSVYVHHAPRLLRQQRLVVRCRLTRAAPATFAAAAAAFNINVQLTTRFRRNLTLLGRCSAVPSVRARIVGKIKAPQWTEWNLSVQQELNRSTVLILNYVGNHGARIPYSNSWPNACDYRQWPRVQPDQLILLQWCGHDTLSGRCRVQLRSRYGAQERR